MACGTPRVSFLLFYVDVAYEQFPESPCFAVLAWISWRKFPNQNVSLSQRRTGSMERRVPMESLHAAQDKSFVSDSYDGVPLSDLWPQSVGSLKADCRSAHSQKGV